MPTSTQEATPTEEEFMNKIEDEYKSELMSDMKKGPSEFDDLLEQTKDGLDIPDHHAEVFTAAFTKKIAEYKAQILDEQQAEDNGTTDNEKLDKAFNELEHEGIVARQDFTCCQTCGTAEIGQNAKDGDYGYVFYHNQDTTRACENAGIMLCFGTFDGKGTTQEVGNKIKAKLEETGLEVKWDGDANKRIQLYPFAWNKRLGEHEIAAE